MAKSHGTGVKAVAQAALTDDPDFLRQIVERTLQEILETEMTAHLGACTGYFSHPPLRRAVSCTRRRQVGADKRRGEHSGPRTMPGPACLWGEPATRGTRRRGRRSGRP